MPDLSIINNLYQYRRYILFNSWNDLRYRYAGTAIGFLWHIVNPLVLIMMYFIVFYYIFHDRSGGNYTFHLISGLITWRTFSETIMRGSNAYIENARYLKHMTIPSVVFVARTCLTETFLLLLHYMLFLIITCFSGSPISWTMITLPFFLFIIQICAFEIALILANLQAFFHDIRHIVEAYLPLWMWTLPVIYPEEMVPKCFKSWLYLNPPYVFIKGIRGVVLHDRFPDLFEWMIIALWLIIFFGLSACIHEKLKHEIPEVI
ncbi:MAG: lipopolysaccharide transport system permease protein [Candidatus Magnetoglobus multicellularis str. Araruama]|uniref:Transport permease protein n=1 Tax=Candidatus Magnetoglobus multicellularis str. Araruama TaxID=890399 RepID=A0A1V1P1M5_9BACT|nr:MAG: lipopolysaccharide transport system permease protein [Candidatus Magnetoglobus multicellularis str. Araruama]